MGVGITSSGITVLFKGDLSPLKNTANEAKSLLRGVGDAAKPASSSITSSFKSAAGGLLDFAGKAGMAVFGLKTIAEAAIGAGAAILGPAAAAEQVNVAFTGLLGSGEKAAAFLKDLRSFAAATPFEFPELAGAARKMLSFGFATSDVIPMMTRLGDAVATMGGGSDEIDRAVTAIGQMHAKTKISSEEMMQLTELGIPAWDMLAKSMGKTTAEVMDMASKGLIPADQGIDALLKGMERFKGGMEAQSKTFVGMMSTLKDNAQLALAAFGGPILEKAKGGLEALGNAVSSPAFQNFAAGAGQAVANVFGLIGEAGVYVGNVLRSLNLTEFHQAWQSVGVLLGSISVHVQKLGSVFSVLKTDADPVAEVIGKLAKGGLDVLTSLLYSVSAALMEVDKALATGKGPLVEFGQGAKRIADIVGLELGQEFKSFGEDARQLGQWFQSSVVPALRQAEPGFRQLAMGVLAALPALMQMRHTLVDVTEHGLKTFGPIIAQVIPPLITFSGVVASGIGGAFRFLMPYIVSATQQIGQFANEIMDRVAPTALSAFKSISVAVGQFYAYWSYVWPGVSQVLAGAWQTIAGIVQIAWALVSGIIKIGLDVMRGDWRMAWNDALNMLSGVWRGIIGVVNGQLNFVVGILKTVSATIAYNLGLPFQQAWNTISGIFNNITSGIQNIINAASKLPGLVGNALPHFAGGVENFGGGVAMVGEHGPELAVLPRGSSVIDATTTARAVKNTRPPDFRQTYASQGNMNMSAVFAALAATKTASIVTPGNSEIHVHVYIGNEEVTDYVMTRTVKESRKGPIRS